MLNKTSLRKESSVGNGPRAAAILPCALGAASATLGDEAGGGEGKDMLHAVRERGKTRCLRDLYLSAVQQDGIER